MCEGRNGEGCGEERRETGADGRVIVVKQRREQVAVSERA